MLKYQLCNTIHMLFKISFLYQYSLYIFYDVNNFCNIYLLNKDLYSSYKLNGFNQNQINFKTGIVQKVHLILDVLNDKYYNYIFKRKKIASNPLIIKILI